MISIMLSNSQYYQQRIIIILRDPLERMYSEMRYSNMCVGTLAAVKAVDDLPVCSDFARSMVDQFEVFEKSHQSLSELQFWIQSVKHIPVEVSRHVAMSFYDAQINLWLSHFPLDDFCVVSQVSGVYLLHFL